MAKGKKVKGKGKKKRGIIDRVRGLIAEKPGRGATGTGGAQRGRNIMSAVEALQTGVDEADEKSKRKK